jgi:hypothetical protein
VGGKVLKYRTKSFKLNCITNAFSYSAGIEETNEYFAVLNKELLILSAGEPVIDCSTMKIQRGSL